MQIQIDAVADQNVGLGAVHVACHAGVLERIRTRAANTGLVYHFARVRIEAPDANSAVQERRSPGGEVGECSRRVGCHVVLYHHGAMDRPGGFHLLECGDSAIAWGREKPPHLHAVRSAQAVDPTVGRAEQDQRSVNRGW